jgi:hypothetical protein
MINPGLSIGFRIKGQLISGSLWMRRVTGALLGTSPRAFASTRLKTVPWPAGRQALGKSCPGSFRMF